MEENDAAMRGAVPTRSRLMGGGRLSASGEALMARLVCATAAQRRVGRGWISPQEFASAWYRMDHPFLCPITHRFRERQPLWWGWTRVSSATTQPWPDLWARNL